MQLKEREKELAKRKARICARAGISPDMVPSVEKLFGHYRTTKNMTFVSPAEVVILDSEESIESKNGRLREAVQQFFRESHGMEQNSIHSSSAQVNLDRNEKTMADILRRGFLNDLVVVCFPGAEKLFVASGRNRFLEIEMMWGRDAKVPVIVKVAKDVADALSIVNAYNSTRHLHRAEVADEIQNHLKKENRDPREDIDTYLYVRLNNPETLGEQPLPLFCHGKARLTLMQRGESPLLTGVVQFLKRVTSFYDRRKLVEKSVSDQQIETGMAVFNGIAEKFQNIIKSGNEELERCKKPTADAEKDTDFRLLMSDVAKLRNNLNDFVLANQTLQAMGGISEFFLYRDKKSSAKRKRTLLGSKRVVPVPELVDELTSALAFACAKALLLDPVSGRSKNSDLEAYIIGRMFPKTKDANEFLFAMNPSSSVLTGTKWDIIKRQHREKPEEGMELPITEDWLKS